MKSERALKNSDLSDNLKERKREDLPEGGGLLSSAYIFNNYVGTRIFCVSFLAQWMKLASV